jgi:hypothetical protein
MSDMEDYEGEYEFDEDMEAAEGICQKRPAPVASSLVHNGIN